MNRIIKKLCNRRDLVAINPYIGKTVKLGNGAALVLGGQEIIPSPVPWERSCLVSFELLERPPTEGVEASVECQSLVERIFGAGVPLR